MTSLISHQFESLSGHVGLRLERLWLSMLPSLNRNYAWCEVDGLRIYGCTSHQRKMTLMQRGAFEPFTVDLFKQAASPGMTVLDLGAYLGYFALIAAREAGRRGKVYAFECDPRSYRFLLHNIQANKCANVVPLPKAITDETGVRAFFLHGGDLTRSSLWDDAHAEATQKVDCTTVDVTLGGEQVDLVKMDVEGGEIKALKGMRQTLRNSGKVVMIVECNPGALSDAGGSAEGLIQELESNGFEIQVIDEAERRLMPVTDDVFAVRDGRGKRNYCNLYCRKG